MALEEPMGTIWYMWPRKDGESWIVATKIEGDMNTAFSEAAAMGLPKPVPVEGVPVGWGVSDPNRRVLDSGERPMASIVVLGTDHRLQGKKFPQHVDDPGYRELLLQLMSGVDFIFEEASGRHPTTAEELKKELRELAQEQPINYMDIDPGPDERNELGIARNTVHSHLINGERLGQYDCVCVEENAKREAVWLCKIFKEKFRNGLVICGLPHTLSFAFKLESVGFETKACCYMPYHKPGVLAVSPGTTNRAK
jgi:hypothetical protein